MQRARVFLSAFALTLLSVAAQAATTIVTTPASFQSQLSGSSYSETFNNLNDATQSHTFAASGFSFTLSAPGDIYFSDDFVQTNQINSALTITFTSGNVSAVGANFYIVDYGNALQAAPVTLTLSDGTTTSFTPASIADGFRGFVSTGLITSLTISAPGQSLYASLDNLTVGKSVTMVPEPASWALASLGVASLLAYRRRRSA